MRIAAARSIGAVFSSVLTVPCWRGRLCDLYVQRAHGRQGDPTGTYSSSLTFLSAVTATPASAKRHRQRVLFAIHPYNSPQGLSPRKVRLASKIYTEILKVSSLLEGFIIF